MKRVILLVMMVSLWGVAGSQPPAKDNASNIQSNRVYQIFASSEADSVSVVARNESLRQFGAPQRSFLAGLGSAIVASYSNKLIQESVNLTANAIGFAVKALSAWIHKNKKDRENWLKIAEQQNHFKIDLGTSSYIEDFYYGTSQNGALDPMNMKFNGFGCMCYLRPDNAPREGELPKAHNKDSEDRTQEKSGKQQDNDLETPEIWEFYLNCKLREDSLGLNHIVNHSKFYVDLDQLVFDTRHSSLPNDSLSGKKQRKFDFRKRKDFTFTVNVKVFSSWVNEAIMLTDNQQIGEFVITAHIDSSDLNPDGVFIYDSALHNKKVTLTGESFIVPRSFTGTANNPSWGTGQYRLVVTVKEDCAMNLPYYQKPPRKKQETSNELAEGSPEPGKSKEKPRWDNKKWKPEWEEMKAGRQRQTVFNDAWRSVTTAYVNKDWVQELVSPLTSAVSDVEKMELSKLLKVDGEGASDAPIPAKSTAPAGNMGNPPAGGY